MRVYLQSIGVFGPGLCDWDTVRPILRDESPYRDIPSSPDPSPTCLKPNELRRSSRVVRWALQVAQEAMERSELKPQDIATVFTSSGGETEILHKICLTLIKPDAVISPTLFHHSVHNAAAGYWSISVQSQQSSSSVSCYDSSFCGGLLDAAALCCTEHVPVLLVSYDLPPPPPLFAARPLVAPFAVALVLSHEVLPQSLCGMDLQFHPSTLGPVTTMSNAALETLRTGNPAARSLSLLAGFAQLQTTSVRLDYLDDQQLEISLTPCHD